MGHAAMVQKLDIKLNSFLRRSLIFPASLDVEKLGQSKVQQQSRPSKLGLFPIDLAFMTSASKPTPKSAAKLCLSPASPSSLPPLRQNSEAPETGKKLISPIPLHLDLKEEPYGKYLAAVVTACGDDSNWANNNEKNPAIVEICDDTRLKTFRAEEIARGYRDVLGNFQMFGGVESDRIHNEFYESNKDRNLDKDSKEIMLKGREKENKDYASYKLGAYIEIAGDIILAGAAGAAIGFLAGGRLGSPYLGALIGYAGGAVLGGIAYRLDWVSNHHQQKWQYHNQAQTGFYEEYLQNVVDKSAEILVEAGKQLLDQNLKSEPGKSPAMEPKEGPRVEPDEAPAEPPIPQTTAKNFNARKTATAMMTTFNPI
jgi:hypothetical protein